MLTVFWSILFFILAISILVTVHEYGHFWVARRLGVKVLRFSIGFGKIIWSRTAKSGTEFAISIIPLGGYVKMLDEREEPVPEELLPYAFNRKPVLSRMAVILAGPVANFLFAIFAYWLIFIIGTTTLIPTIGEIVPNSIAAQAELQTGSEIAAVDGETTDSWRAVRLAVIARVGEKSQLTISTKMPDETQAQPYVLNLASWNYDIEDPALLLSLGLKPYFPPEPVVIASVLEQTPAEQVGLQAGDQILAVDGQKIGNWPTLLEILAKKPNQSIQLLIERDGSEQVYQITLRSTEDKGESRGFLGIVPQISDWPTSMLRKKQYGPLAAIVPAAGRTWEMTSLSWKLLCKMFTGQVSPRGISGPIGIAQGIGYSASLGFIYFMSFLALISISLGIVNLLPIPVLDGGHFLFCLIELFTRRPVSKKLQLIATQFGIFLLIAVMILALYNDISRLG